MIDCLLSRDMATWGCLVLYFNATGKSHGKKYQVSSYNLKGLGTCALEEHART